MTQWCRKRPTLEWLKNVITALACTGLRISELASLRWSDIDLEAKKISLTDESVSARKKGGESRTNKSRRSRSFPVHPDFLPVLENLSQSTSRVFYGPRGVRIKPDTVRRVLVCDVLTPLSERFPSWEGEVGFIDGRLHSFRHYFCSNNSVPEQIVMLWLGLQESTIIITFTMRKPSSAWEESTFWAKTLKQPILILNH